jgi:hypothetical protein
MSDSEKRVPGGYFVETLVSGVATTAPPMSALDHLRALAAGLPGPKRHVHAEQPPPALKRKLSPPERNLLYRMMTCTESFDLKPGEPDYEGPLRSLVEHREIEVLTTAQLDGKILVTVAPTPNLHTPAQRRAHFFACVGEVDPELPNPTLQEALAAAREAFE